MTGDEGRRREEGRKKDGRGQERKRGGGEEGEKVGRQGWDRQATELLAS